MRKLAKKKANLQKELLFSRKVQPPWHEHFTYKGSLAEIMIQVKDTLECSGSDTFARIMSEITTLSESTHKT